MKVNVEELNSVKRQLTVEVPAAEVDKTIDKLLVKHGSKAKIKGFRPGKVPRKVIERYYGPQAAYESAEELIRDQYVQAMDESGLSPLAQPEFDFQAIPARGEDFVFQVFFDVRPEFDVDPESYKGFEIKEPELEATDDEVEKRVDQMRDRQAMLKTVEESRPAQTGDVVVIDYQSFDGDDPLEGGTADNVDVELGAGQVQEEIEVALVKTKPGDIVEATVHMDDDAPNEEMRGKDIKFKLVVKELKQKLLPDADDDFARSVSPEFETIDALKGKIKDELERQYQQEKDMQVRRQILDHIRDLGEFDIPETLVKQELEEMVASFKSRLRQSGMDPDTVGFDEERLSVDFKPEAEKKVRAGIVLGRISELEKVEVEDGDYEAHYQKVAEQTGQPAESIKDIYIKNNMLPSVAAQILEEKTLQALKAGAIIKIVDPAELAEELAQKQAEDVAASDNEGEKES